MSIHSDKPKIYILKNGPYLVKRQNKAVGKSMVPKGKPMFTAICRIMPQVKTQRFAVRKISKCPLCDGMHTKVEFDGTETAKNTSYRERAREFEGPGLTLLDDERCALARFCHRDQGMVWSLLRRSDEPRIFEEIVKTAEECPAGRFEVHDRAGNIIKPYFEPAIEVLQDVERSVSGPLAVKGEISIESQRRHGLRNTFQNGAVPLRCPQKTSLFVTRPTRSSVIKTIRHKRKSALSIACIQKNAPPFNWRGVLGG